jgi:hypothetical protein
LSGAVGPPALQAGPCGDTQGYSINVYEGRRKMSSAATSSMHTLSIDAIYEAVLDPSAFRSVGRILSGPLEGSTIWTGRAAAAHPAVEATALEGAISYTGELEIRTEQGTLKMLNVGVFEPKPYGTVTGTHRIIEGTGIFDGAQGDLFWYGQATNEAGTEFRKNLRGQLQIKRPA